MREDPCPRFRPDLVTRRVVEGGDAGYAVQDPVSGYFYRLDPLTHDLTLFLDGKRTPDEVLDALNQLYPQYDFTREYLKETLDYLRKMGFLDDPFRRNLLVQERAKAARKRLLSAESLKNILFVQVGTVDATPALKFLYPLTRVMFTAWWVIGTTLASLLAMWILWERRDEVVGNLLTIFSLENSTWVGLAVLYVTLFLIVVAHEFGHGLCCMHYGGKPSKIGFLFMYFMPGMYCDVSDVYFFENRWHRTAVALAGGYVELQAFCLGTFLWILTPPDLLLHDVGYRVMLFSGITGLIFNYNPLIKLDGYFVLMHWLDVPDLRERSFDWLRSKTVSLISGKPMESDDSTRRERRIFTIYGITAMIYSVAFLWISLILVRNIFVGAWREAGFVIFAIFFIFITRRMWNSMGRGAKLLVMEHAGFIRRKWALLSGALALLICLCVIPLPHHLKVDAVLIPTDQQAIRTPVAGRIEAVLVNEGEPVRGGAVLAVVVSPEQRSSLEVEQADVERALLDARSRQMYEHRSLSPLTSEASARWAASEWETQQSWIVAPADGRVLSWRPQRLMGWEVEPGDSLLAFGRTDTLTVLLQVSERDLADLEIGQGAQLRLLSDPGRVIPFRLDLIDFAPSREPVTGQGAAALAERDLPPAEFQARGRIGNPDGALRPGLTGKVLVRGPSLNIVQRALRLYARLVRADFWF